MTDVISDAKKIQGSESRADYLDRARAVSPLVEADADTIERTGKVTDRVYQALREAGLFWLLVPREYGGAGQDVLSLLEVLEEISQADASTGWSLMANMASGGVAGGFLADEALEVLYHGSEMAITAGQLGPIGKGVAVDGGFQTGGRYQFGSGSDHANWIGGGFVVLEDGKPRRLPSGEVDMRVGFYPRDAVVMQGNWDVAGLVGTSSYDYEVPEQFVSEAFTFERTSVKPRRDEPVYYLGNIGMGVAGHAGVALGLMRRALREVAHITEGKKRGGYPQPVGEYPVFLYEFSRFEAKYQAARSYVFKVFGEAQESAAATKEISAEQRARLRQAVTWTHETATEVVGFCHLWGGTQSFRNPSALGRATRDLGVATQHVLMDPITLVDSAGPILAHWQSEGA